ncbi:MAG: hypothetical protein NVS2B6_09510 [Thermoleophilaceae bacterium]
MLAGALALALSAWLAAVVVGGTGFASMPALRLAPLAHQSSIASHSRFKFTADRHVRGSGRELARATPAST